MIKHKRTGEAAAKIVHRMEQSEPIKEADINEIADHAIKEISEAIIKEI